MASVAESLKRLRRIAEAMPRPDCAWESQPRFGPPLTPAQIDEIEHIAGFPVQEDLRDFLSEAGAVVAMSVHNGYWLGDISKLLQQPRAANAMSPEHSQDLFLPVATDGGGNMFLLTQNGRVWHWNHETGQTSAVSPTFAGFLSRLADDWEAYINNTPGWRFLV